MASEKNITLNHIYYVFFFFLQFCHWGLESLPDPLLRWNKHLLVDYLDLNPATDSSHQIWTESQSHKRLSGKINFRTPCQGKLTCQSFTKETSIMLCKRALEGPGDNMLHVLHHFLLYDMIPSRWVFVAPRRDLLPEPGYIWQPFLRFIYPTLSFPRQKQAMIPHANVTY